MLETPEKTVLPIEQKFIDAVLNDKPPPCDILLVRKNSPEKQREFDEVVEILKELSWHQQAENEFRHGTLTNGSLIPTGVAMWINTRSVELVFAESTISELQEIGHDLFLALHEFKWEDIAMYYPSSGRDALLHQLNRLLLPRFKISINVAKELIDAENAAIEAELDSEAQEPAPPVAPDPISPVIKAPARLGMTVVAPVASDPPGHGLEIEKLDKLVLGHMSKEAQNNLESNEKLKAQLREARCKITYQNIKIKALKRGLFESLRREDKLNDQVQFYLEMSMALQEKIEKLECQSV